MLSGIVTRVYGWDLMAADYVAWINGEFVPLARASLSVMDAGITTGASVTERLRTFRHQPFLLDEHLERLARSAEAAFVPLRDSVEAIGDLVGQVVDRNSKLIGADDDLAVSVFATAGTSAGPTLCVYATHIAANDYAAYYEKGQSLVVPSRRAIPNEALSPQIKTRNRLHWHIADRLAAQVEPASKALLIDEEGFVTETAAGNVFVVRGNRLMTPKRSKSLEGISQAYVMRLAERLGLACDEEDLRIEDLATAEEVFTSSSVYCLLSVVRLNQSRIADGRPGPTYRRLLASWSEDVGVDIVEQMQRMASER